MKTHLYILTGSILLLAACSKSDDSAAPAAPTYQAHECRVLTQTDSANPANHTTYEYDTQKRLVKQTETYDYGNGLKTKIATYTHTANQIEATVSSQNDTVRMTYSLVSGKVMGYITTTGRGARQLKDTLTFYYAGSLVPRITYTNSFYTSNDRLVHLTTEQNLTYGPDGLLIGGTIKTIGPDRVEVDQSDLYTYDNAPIIKSIPDFEILPGYKVITGTKMPTKITTKDASGNVFYTVTHVATINARGFLEKLQRNTFSTTSGSSRTTTIYTYACD